MNDHYIKIFIAGDVVPQHRTSELYKNVKSDTLFSDYRAIMESSDINIVNLEVPIIKGNMTPIRKSGPSLYTRESTLETLKNAGFNCITLANNHFRDQGEQGVRDTINAAKRMQINYVGGGCNIEEARSIKYFKTKGKTIALINVCESEYSIATEEYGGANPIDLINLYEDITEAKSKSDYIIIVTHGGTELYNLPSPRIKKLFRHLVDLGADAVINHHQHCFSGYEEYNGKVIFYGLGNFNFDNENNKIKKCWYYGYSVLLRLGEEIRYELIPHVQCMENEATSILKDQHVFNDTINSINNIIKDDKELVAQFKSMAIKKQKAYVNYFESYNGRILNKLFRLGILPTTLNKKKSLFLLNFLRCESHNDVLKEILKHKIEE